MICKHCGNPLSDDSKFCGVCGNEVVQEQEKSFCTNCGALMGEGSVFCSNCGQAVGAQPHSQPQYPQQNMHSPNTGKNGDNKSTVIIILAVVIIALLLGIGAFLLCNHFYPANSNPQNRISPTPTAASVKASVSPKPTQTPKSTPKTSPSSLPDRINANPGVNEYMYASDTGLVTEDELKKLTQAEIRLLLNEMYARHGYIFSTKEYSDYFMKRTWYIPRYTSQSDAEAGFNDMERRNKIIISDYEKSKGWR